jgi:neutral trehalase
VSGIIHTDDLSAEIFPLYVGLADNNQSKIIFENLQMYLGDIGLATTRHRPGDELTMDVEKYYQCQWELNAWPPLMMVAVEGLERYYEKLKAENDPDCEKFKQLSIQLQAQWVNALDYRFDHPDPGKKSVFYEKMPHKSTQLIKKGEYGNLPGFGWTLASYVTFLNNLVTQGCTQLLKNN